MKHLLSITSLAGVFAAASLQADWTVVSTFDDDSALNLIEDVTNIPDSGAESTIVDGQWSVHPGNLFENTSNLFAMLDMGADLKAEALANGGGVVTVYFEFTQPMIEGSKAILDTVWGLANVTPAEVLETGYNSYNAMQRINSGSGAFEGRNGGGYEEIAPLDGDVKYSMWLVVDFGLNAYEAYVQGGQWTEVTKIPSTTEDVWFFRQNPEATTEVRYFLVALSRGNTGEEKGRDPSLFDNIAYDSSGENLTVPGGGGGGEMYLNTWAVDSQNRADTGDWLGWLFVEYQPWVYSYSLGTYLYVAEETFSESGSWAYAPRSAE